ncbi:octaprenyl diphosphate synthase [Inmirania thermothiophila]|uniref:Octaprenyl diphosphate synthase n=1 Tax=Inmirania thermothiophila TaxID=1750597 RepID=A0A3N1YBC6_9GAMM|nr:octaprenyl diphosphate synthase [Inmirania thermothiophila]ROR34952.1 octaprenyl-diphosphate synthase [Inmirania thermothiophila]
MDIEAIRSLAAEDMRAVDELIRKRLSSDVALINELGHYIIAGGGKRLRPLVTVIGARALGYDGPWHVQLAAIIEFIHTATLLHDDVVDASELRRGRETANALWGNEASVLVGDFLYSRSFEMMVEINNMRVMEILAHATNTIAEGEVLQLLNCHDPDTTEERYLEVVRRKTAKLFEAAAQLGAVLAGGSPEQEQAMARYGLELGVAFQLVDDALDYGASGEDIGKNVGDDLAEGKPTLPLIHVLRTGTPSQVALVREAIEQGGRERIDEVLAAIEATGAIAYTAQRAREQAQAAIAALEAIDDSPYRQALAGIVEFAVSRTY